MSKIDWTKRHDPDAALFDKIVPALIGAAIAAIACLPFGFATGWASGRVANIIVSDCPPCPDEMEVRGHNKKLQNIIWDCQAHMQLCKWAKPNKGAK